MSDHVTRTCHPKGFHKKDVLRNLTKFTCVVVSFDKVAYRRSATSLNKTPLHVHWEICKDTCFPEHHRTIAFNCSNINKSEGEVGKPICKL